jgi:hypothetical protein
LYDESSFCGGGKPARIPQSRDKKTVRLLSLAYGDEIAVDKTMSVRHSEYAQDQGMVAY